MQGGCVRVANRYFAGLGVVCLPWVLRAFVGLAAGQGEGSSEGGSGFAGTPRVTDEKQGTGANSPFEQSPGLFEWLVCLKPGRRDLFNASAA